MKHDWDEVVRLYLSGATVNAICTELHASINEVYYVLHRRRVKLRGVAARKGKADWNAGQDIRFGRLGGLCPPDVTEEGNYWRVYEEVMKKEGHQPRR